MEGITYKRCPCGTTGINGKKACQKDHGSWYWRVDIKTNGSRRQPSKGGYETKEKAKEGLADFQATQRKRTGRKGIDDTGLTVALFLEMWLRICEERYRKGTLAKKTLDGYRTAMRSFWIPAIGALRLGELENWDIDEALKDGLQRTDTPPPARADLPRQQCVGIRDNGERCTKLLVGRDRCTWHGGEPLTEMRGRMGRVVAKREPGTLHKYLGDLRTALEAAVRRKYIAENPARGVMESLPARGKSNAQWWEPEQVGIFLLDLELGVAAVTPDWGSDPAPEPGSDRWLAAMTQEWADALQADALYELCAFGGPRRGEMLGLPWEERLEEPKNWRVGVDLNGTVPGVDFGPSVVDPAGPQPCYKCEGEHVGTLLQQHPKTRAGWRWVPVVEVTAQKLRLHQLAQAEMRRRLGPELYVDHGLAFASPTGAPLYPSSVTDDFQARAARLGLPIIKLHEVRHGACALLLQAGVPIEVVSMLLGHASVDVTRRIYAHYLRKPTSEGMAAAVALVRNGKTAEAAAAHPAQLRAALEAKKPPRAQPVHTSGKIGAPVNSLSALLARSEA